MATWEERMKRAAQIEAWDNENKYGTQFPTNDHRCWKCGERRGDHYGPTCPDGVHGPRPEREKGK